MGPKSLTLQIKEGDFDLWREGQDGQEPEGRNGTGLYQVLHLLQTFRQQSVSMSWPYFKLVYEGLSELFYTTMDLVLFLQVNDIEHLYMLNKLSDNGYLTLNSYD